MRIGINDGASRSDVKHLPSTENSVSKDIEHSSSTREKTASEKLASHLSIRDQFHERVAEVVHLFEVTQTTPNTCTGCVKKPTQR